MMGAEESGGFGFGMHLPERDGIYADLLLLDLFLRERARRPLAGVARDRALPRDRRTVVLPAHRRPRRAGRLPRDQAAPARRPARGGADRARRRARRPDACRSTPTTASSSSSPTGRGCWSGRRGTEPLVRVYTEATSAEPARRAPRRRRAPGPRHVTRRPRPAGAARRQAVGPRADLGPHRPLRRQDPGHRGRQAAVAPAPRGQGRIDPRDLRPAAPVPGGRQRDASGRGARAGRRIATCRPAGSTATRRSSGRELMEVSTPELDDVVRLEDDFGREGTNAPDRPVDRMISAGARRRRGGCTLWVNATAITGRGA